MIKRPLRLVESALQVASGREIIIKRANNNEWFGDFRDLRYLWFPNFVLERRLDDK